MTQDQITRRGHAVECRIYAEEPRAGFLPRAGTLHRLRQPTSEKNVRVSSFLEGKKVESTKLKINKYYNVLLVSFLYF